MITYSKTFCWSSMIIGHYYNPCFYLWIFPWGMWCYSIQSVTFFRRKFCVCNNGGGWILPGELSSLTPPPPTPPPSPVNCPCHLRNQNFLSREGDIHVHAPPIYGRSVRRRKIINEMVANIPVRSLMGENFPRRTSLEPLYMASLDVESLFTNIPLEETIKNCVNDLFSNNFYSGKLSRKHLYDLLKSLLKLIATTESSFIFDNKLYK